MAHTIQVKSMQVASNMEKDKYSMQMGIISKERLLMVTALTQLSLRKMVIHIKGKCETSDIMGKEN